MIVTFVLDPFVPGTFCGLCITILAIRYLLLSFSNPSTEVLPATYRKAILVIAASIAVGMLVSNSLCFHLRFI
jgi:hypothetical protein